MITLLIFLMSTKFNETGRSFSVEERGFAKHCVYKDEIASSENEVKHERTNA